MQNPDLFSRVEAYIDALFVPNDPVLTAALADARAAGLPDIQISPGQGKFLYLLTKISRARKILEIGALGGYSTIWLARALPEDGKLTSLELDPRHAEIARLNIKNAGLADKVDIIVGSALETLPAVVRAEGPFDLVFLDADKDNYVNYFKLLADHMRPGGLILADNVVRAGAVMAPEAGDALAKGAQTFNAMLAADDRWESFVLQQVGAKGHDGLAIARLKEATG